MKGWWARLLRAAVAALALEAPAASTRAELVPARDPTPGHFRGGPLHGPTPTRLPPPPARPSSRRGAAEQLPELAPPWPEPRGAPSGPRPYVDRRGRWVGHQAVPAEGSYELDRRWANQRFPGKVGHGHPYRLAGWDPENRRFRLRRFSFAVAAADLPWVSDWSWNDDDIVLYDDPDHAGWYLAYNARLGTFVHVQYAGPP